MTPPPILVLHGALGAADQMRPIADALAPLGAVRVPEFPGHGTTPLGAREFSVPGFVAGLAGALRPDERPVAFGYSMGGYVALALEAARPGTFAGIVTLGTKFLWTPEAAAREAARLDAAVIREKVPRFAAALEARHAAADGWEPLLARTAALLAQVGARPLLDAAAMARVTCPLTVAVGEQDDTVGPDEARAVAAWAPDARVQVLAGVGHPIERVPVALVEGLVRDLLARIPA